MVSNAKRKGKGTRGGKTTGTPAISRKKSGEGKRAGTGTMGGGEVKRTGKARRKRKAKGKIL